MLRASVRVPVRPGDGHGWAGGLGIDGETPGLHEAGQPHPLIVYVSVF